MITEPDVTLTDYALAAECSVFACWVYGQGNPLTPVRIWWIVFFAAAACASIFGGTVHGFFRNEKTTGYRTLWPAALIAIGVTGLAAWNIGATLLFSSSVANWIFGAAAAEFALYCFFALFVTRSFLLAVTHYLPAAIFFFAALLLKYRRAQDPGMLLGALGLVLTFVATGVQRARIPLHSTRFNHNALYHLILAAGLFLIFWAS